MMINGKEKAARGHGYLESKPRPQRGTADTQPQQTAARGEWALRGQSFRFLKKAWKLIFMKKPLAF